MKHIIGRNKKSRPASSISPVTIFDLPIANTAASTVLYWLRRRITDRRKTTMQFVNAHCCNVLVNNTDYKRALQNADCLLPDGAGIAIAMRFRGVRLQENLNGTDLVPKLLANCSQLGVSVFFLGGEAGVAEDAAKYFKEQYPFLSVVGTRDGFFSEHETRDVINEINNSKAELLLVGFGVPTQETWLETHGGELGTTVNVGVGGFFDYYSSRIPRAPKMFRQIGMEWVWRLAMEPKRLWRRYIIGNPLFLYRAWRDARKNRTRVDTLLNPNRFIAIRQAILWSVRKQMVPILKRLLDVSVSGGLLIFLSPIFLLVSCAIRLESPGPVFFGQTRVGHKGRDFTMWKFRSMYQDAEKRRAALEEVNEMDGGVTFKMRNDPRITKVGKTIRRLSIDELPQLWNVLRGSMSLVGPRPALPSEVSTYSLEARGRLLGKPGITGIWQVSGRSNIPFPQQLEMDLQYLDEAKLKTDLKLLAKTVPAVISGRGAY